MEDLEKLYSKDMQSVLKLMEKQVEQYPTYTYTIDYLILSILQSKNCDAYKILEEISLSTSLEVIENMYSNQLQMQCEVSNLHIINPNKRKEYDKGVLKVLGEANILRDELGDEQINSIHVLLVILTDRSENREIFEKVGVDYNLIEQRFKQNKDEVKTPNKSKKSTKATTIVTPPTPNPSNFSTAQKKTKTKAIEDYTTNINHLAERGQVDELIGREREMSEVINTLLRRNKNNIILVGNAGVGKTSILNGLSKRIIEGKVPSGLDSKEVLRVDMSKLMAGGSFRGVLEAKLTSLYQEVKQGNYILSFDNLHEAVGDKYLDGEIVRVLSEILNDNSVQVICTTNFKDFKSVAESHPSIVNRLEKIIIDPMSIDETVNILNKNKHYYESYHNVVYDDLSIITCVKLSDRYITNRSLPDSAIDMLDKTGAYVNGRNDNSDDKMLKLKAKLNKIVAKKNKALSEEEYEKVDMFLMEERTISLELKDLQKKKLDEKETVAITEEDIMEVLSNTTKIPIKSMSRNDLKSLGEIDGILKKQVFGQDEAIDKITNTIKRNRFGLKSNHKKPDVFMLLGVSGVGKTYLCKKIAEVIYGSENNMVRIDCSELSESYSTSKILGSAAGYVGYNNPTIMDEIKKKPHSLLLLDEFEKCHPNIHNLFLQVFDEGMLTLSSGEIVDFTNSMIVMTTNTGAKEASLYKQVGYSVTSETEDKKREEILNKELKKKFTPEFLNRINSIIFFNPLKEVDLKNILRLNLEKLNDLLLDKGYSMKYDDDVVDWLYKQLKEDDKNYGARPILRIITEFIEEPLTNLLIESEYEAGWIFTIIINKNNELIIA